VDGELAAQAPQWPVRRADLGEKGMRRGRA
jgi:hypothetical protein